jgi:death-on-curing family protein
MAKHRITERLDIKEVERLAFRLAQEHLTFDEPIPVFSTRSPNVLESCLETPFQKFFGQVPYPSLVSKASMLFYMLIKNHPFQNGNKRIAVTTLMVFLLKNGKQLKVELSTLHKFTIWIAKSRSKEKGFYIMAIEQFIKKNLKDLEHTLFF